MSISRYYVYRYGSNAANQSMNNGPVHVAIVEAESSDSACTIASKRVTVYNNQYLSARLADEVDEEDQEIDNRVEVLD